MGDEPKMNPTHNPLPQVDVGDLIPQRLRAWVYPAGVLVGVLTWLVAEVTVIWLPEYTDQIIQTSNRILVVVTLVTGGMGTAYRPSPPSL
jgi:hypothetical protein